MSYDPEEMRRLYWEEEMSLEEIAEQEGVTRQAIHQRMESHDIPRRSRSFIDTDEVVRLYKSGLSKREVAEEIGCSYSSVQDHLIKSGAIDKKSVKAEAP